MYQLFQYLDDKPSILVHTFQTLDEAYKWWQSMSDAAGPQHFLTENNRIIAVESPHAPRLVFV